MIKILMALMLLATAARADLLDELGIPEDLGAKGREALEKFYGRTLLIEYGKWAGLYEFEPGGRVTWKKRNGKTRTGHFGDSAYATKMCLDFSYDESECFEVQQYKDRLVLYNEASGQIVANASAGAPQPAIPALDQEYCENFKQILSATAANSMRSLIDDNRDAIEGNGFSDESYWTKNSIGGESCRFETTIEDKISCEVFYEHDAPEAEGLYEFLSGQILACVGDQFAEVSRDQQVWLKYEEIDFESNTTKRIPKSRYKPASYDAVRSSDFTTLNGVKSYLRLGYRSICRDVVDCKNYYSVMMTFTPKK